MGLERPYSAEGELCVSMDGLLDSRERGGRGHDCSVSGQLTIPGLCCS